MSINHLICNIGYVIYNIFNMTASQSAHSQDYLNKDGKVDMKNYLDNTEGKQDIMPVVPKETDNQQNVTTKPDSTKPVVATETQTFYELDKNSKEISGGTLNNAEDYVANLDYIGEFDFDRMKANMDELI